MSLHFRPSSTAVELTKNLTRLGSLAKNLLFELGSALVQNLHHRDAWYLVGQKGIKGFSPIEEVRPIGIKKKVSKN